MVAYSSIHIYFSLSGLWGHCVYTGLFQDWSGFLLGGWLGSVVSYWPFKKIHHAEWNVWSARSKAKECQILKTSVDTCSINRTAQSESHTWAQLRDCYSLCSTGRHSKLIHKSKTWLYSTATRSKERIGSIVKSTIIGTYYFDVLGKGQEVEHISPLFSSTQVRI